MLLAPGTDDLEQGNGSPRVLPSFTYRRSLLSHQGSPSLMATDSQTPQRSRPCSTGHRPPVAHQAKLTHDSGVTAWTDPMTWRRHRDVHDLPADMLLTPGTDDLEIALAPVLTSRLDLMGVLTKPAALLPYRSCPS
jgi:hypothetical protein